MFKCDYDLKVSLTTAFMIISLTVATVVGKVSENAYLTVFTGIASGYFGSLHGEAKKRELESIGDPYK